MRPSEMLVNACTCHTLETSIKDILGGVCDFTGAKRRKNGANYLDFIVVVSMKSS